MKKNLLFAILCVLGLFGTLNAQDVVTIDGTVGEYTKSTSKYVPAYCAQKWAVSQQYYMAEEIGKSTGTIETIAFKTADVATEAGKTFKRKLVVYMLNTEDYAVVGKTMKQVSATDQVFADSVEFTSNAWVTIDIADFEYTGKNVLVCVNDVTGVNVSGGITFDCYKSSFTIDGSNASRSFYLKPATDATSAFDPTASALMASSSNNPVPFVKFTFAEGTTEEYAEPSDPTNFVATALNESKIQLTWDAAAETQGYNIYEGTEFVANVEGTSYIVRNISEAGEHCYTIKGANGPKESTGVTACDTIVTKRVKAITVGKTGDYDSQMVPMILYTQNSWVEQIYTAAEIGKACTIERISFATKPQNNYSTPFATKEIKIYLAETTKTDCADMTLTAQTDLKLVFSDTDIIIGDQEWETFELDEPFVYNGEKNLAVVVAKSADVTSTQYFWHTNNIPNGALYATTATYPDATTEVKANGQRAVIRFAWETEAIEPVAPVVEAAATSDTTITLTWAAVEDATSYNIYSADTLVASVTKTTYTVTGLTAETEYAFVVKAVNEFGESAASNEAKATTLAATSDPEGPVTPEKPETGYFPTTFYYDFENGKLDGLTVIDANEDGTTWQFVDGMNGGLDDGKGVYSGEVGKNEANDYLISATKCSMTETSEFSFAFTPYVEVVAGSIIYFREKLAVVVSEDGETFENVWTYEFDEYIKWQDTTISLKAYAGKDLYIGIHHYGSEDGLRLDNIKLDSKEPSVPANFKAEAAPTTITLTWDAVANATSYNVYAVTKEVVEEVETLKYTEVKKDLKETKFVVEGLTYETEYSYTVTAVNEYAESKYAAVVTVTTLGEPLPEGVELLLKETFESYTVGDKIAEKGADYWTTWSKDPGSSEDGVVAELEGNKCGHLTYGVDQVLLLGGYKAGVFELEYDIYVPEGKGAYYNILHEFNGSNSLWALQAYLQMTDTGEGKPVIKPGHGTIHAGKNAVADLPCVYNGWMHFRIYININTDKAEFYYTLPNGEEKLAFDWQWKQDSFGEKIAGRKLDAMGFFPPVENTEYYIDNLMLKRIGGETATIVNFSEENIEASMACDDMSSVELEIENAGTSVVEYKAWVDYGKGEMSENMATVTYALEDFTNATAIGWTADEPVTFEIAALFPSTAYSNSVMGTYITDAAYFLGEWKTSDGAVVPMLEPGTDMTFRIYSQGINGIPGAVLAEKTIPCDSILLDWNFVTFDTPVALTGFDFYIAVEMTQCVKGAALVLDGNKDTALTGYADLCRQSKGEFKSLTEFTEGQKYGNWTLAVNCTGNPIQGGWAELSKKSGELQIDAKETINVEFSTFGLKKGETYNANIFFQTDTELGNIELPISLYIWGEDVEEILSNTYNIYPNPTTAKVTVEGENINYIAVYNSVGQLVKVVKTQDNVVDMSAYDNGVYFFNIIDNAGNSSVQRVVVAK